MKLPNVHLMPWPKIPADARERYRSSWMAVPNTVYDPVEGTRISVRGLRSTSTRRA